MTLPIAPVDHIAAGMAHVLAQYRDKPFVQARLACYLNQLQLIEDQLTQVHEAFRPLSASGFRLDWVGAKVGQARTGSTDDVYRLYILARIRANRSEGKAPDIESIAKLLLTDWLDYTEHLVVVVETGDAKTAEALRTVQSLLQAAAPAGVPVYLVAGYDPDMSFSTVGEGVDTAAGGFDSVAGSETIAGYWAQIVAS